MEENFYSFCEDEHLKVKVEGMPIHNFFSLDKLMTYGREPIAQSCPYYTQIVDMPITTFLGLAEPIPKDDAKRHSSIKEFKEEVLAGKKCNWDIPCLTIRKNEDERWKVVGHDGRHRAILLKELGYSEMPVRVEFPYDVLYKSKLPPKVWCQNDSFKEREKYQYPFPITEKNYKTPYMGITGRDIEMPRCVGDEYPKENKKALNKFLKGEEAITFMGKAPKSCVTAKRNFEKNYVPNVAYRKDNTMPAANLKEYLEGRGQKWEE